MFEDVQREKERERGLKHKPTHSAAAALAAALTL